MSEVPITDETIRIAIKCITKGFSNESFSYIVDAELNDSDLVAALGQAVLNEWVINAIENRLKYDEQQ
jgi:hypothetical protein